MIFEAQEPQLWVVLFDEVANALGGSTFDSSKKLMHLVTINFLTNFRLNRDEDYMILLYVLILTP